MSKYLRHFTTVGDDHTAQWQDEELHEASDELGPATGQMPQGELSFRDSLKMLYSSNKFQVWNMSGVGNAHTINQTQLVIVTFAQIKSQLWMGNIRMCVCFSV